MHQRSCRVIIGLSGETFETQCNEEYLPANELPPSVIDDQVLTKVGVKLPKSIDQWKVANDYFQASLPIHDIASSGLNTTINRMNKIIYEYFEINFGLVNSVKTTEINNKYKGYSKHALKSCLKQLKREGADPAEIKVVAHLLRCKLNSSKLHLNEGQVDQQIKKNFLGFC